MVGNREFRVWSREGEVVSVSELVSAQGMPIDWRCVILVLLLCIFVKLYTSNVKIRSICYATGGGACFVLQNLH